jgi:DNA-binding MarR family transcriptional regulator
LYNDSIFHLLIQVAKANHQQIHKRLHNLEVHRGQPPLIQLLWKEDGRTQKELSESLHLSSATMAKMVKRMEKSGFIVKKQDSQDLRKSRVYLTTKGKQIKEELDRIQNEIEEKATTGFTTEEKLLLRRFLIQIRDNLLDK